MDPLTAETLHNAQFRTRAFDSALTWSAVVGVLGIVFLQTYLYYYLIKPQSTFINNAYLRLAYYMICKIYYIIIKKFTSFGYTKFI